MPKLGSIENLYILALASVFYLVGGASAVNTIFFGCLASFGFLPSYKLLFEGAKCIHLHLLAGNAALGVGYIFLMYFMLKEESLIEMLVLFVSSCVAAKGPRFFIVGLMVNRKGIY